MNLSKLIIIIIFLFFLFPQSAKAWWDEDWQHRAKFSINNLSLSDNLTNFTLLIDLSQAPAGFWAAVDSSGDDIRLIDEDDATDLTSQSHLEKWDYANQKGLLWVKKNIQSTLFDPDESLWLYYANPAASSVFSDLTKAASYDANYKAVWHLEESGGSNAYIADETSSSIDGTPSSGSSYTTGKINGAYDFDGFNDYINFANNADLNLPGFTLEAWVKIDSLESSPEHPVISRSNSLANQGYGIVILSNGKVRCDFNGENGITSSESEVADNTWVYIACTYDGSTLKLFVNGENTDYDSKESFTNYNGDLYLATAVDDIGGDDSSLDGIIDEVKISSLARSPAWFAFTYQTEGGNSGSFGNEQPWVIADLNPDLNIFSASDWSTDLSTTHQELTTTVGLKNDNYRIASFDVNFTDSLDWSLLSSDASAGKAFFHYPGGYTSLPGNSGGSYTLYIPKGNFYSLAICPNATSLAEINSNCSNRYYLNENSSNVESVYEDGVSYWKVSSLTGTGGEGIEPFLTFSIEEVGVSTLTNGVTTTISSTYNGITFGTLMVDSTEYAAHKLSVSTNAEDGYTVKLKLQSFLQGEYPGNIISEFAGNSASWSDPKDWTTPTGTIPNVNTGWIGVNTSDERVPSWQDKEAKFAPLNTIFHDIMHSNSADEEGTSAYITYAIEVNQYQPTDVYIGSIVYNILPDY